MSFDARGTSQPPTRVPDLVRIGSESRLLRLGVGPMAWVGVIALVFALLIATLAYPPGAHPFSAVQSNDRLTVAFATFPWLAVVVGADWWTAPRTPQVDPLVVLRAN